MLAGGEAPPSEDWCVLSRPRDMTVDEYGDTMNMIAAPLLATQQHPSHTPNTSVEAPHRSFAGGIPETDPEFPLTLDCFGGTWQGTVKLESPSFIRVRVQGFPPIVSHQHISLTDAAAHSEEDSGILEGLIRDVRLERDSTFWDGTTNFLIEPLSGLIQHPGLLSHMLQVNLGQASIRLQGHIVEADDTLPALLPALVKETRTSTHSAPRPSSSSEMAVSTVQSTPLSMVKANGQRIHAFHDSRVDSSSSSLPIVVIAPGYAETKRDYVTLAYYLATNGFEVIRYDHTNHVGASDGDHFHFTLSSMKEDFHTVTEYVRTHWPHRSVIGLAASMAARVAVKAEAERSSVDHLMLLVGIVNVRRTVAAVHLEDVFAQYASGHNADSANILGLNVGKQFLHDACQNRFVTLDETLKDAQQLQVPVMMLSAGQDAWVATDDLQAFSRALGDRLRKQCVMPDSLHRVQENPKLARQIYRQIVEYCRETSEPSQDHPAVIEPNRQLLGRQHRREKQAHLPNQTSTIGAGFWKDYLQHFQTVGNCEDYLTLLDHVFHTLGPILPGHRVLDAGCGNGTAGLSLCHRLSTAPSSHSQANPVQYVGIDVIPEALTRAKEAMSMMAFFSGRTANAPLPGLRASWANLDLHHPLPFPDGSFDRILSNLVLGYIKKPEAALQELYRVLAPGGRMVISNLKPDGDFSGIYQRLVSQAHDQQERIQARELLNNYGKIRQAEKEGRFQFYNQAQWRHVLDALGQPHAQIYPTFANQAYLIIIEKPQASIGSVHSEPTAFSQLPSRESFSMVWPAAA